MSGSPNGAFVRVKVSGEFGMFTRPDSKVERVSYETITPSAARNILDSICFRPQMRWVVIRIAVLKPIQFYAARRNELQSKIAPGSVRQWMKNPTEYTPQLAGAGASDATPRNSLLLQNVSYVIEAYPHVYAPNAEDTPTKYMAMFNRRLEKGQSWQMPYLGCREFAARCEKPCPEDHPVPVTLPLGLMLYDIIFDPIGGRNRAVFFDARLENGIMDTHPERAIPDAQLRKELLECSLRH
jgi:CRISPR-associated protein Cas5d